MLEFISHGLIPVAIGAVAVVLLPGLLNMMHGGSSKLTLENSLQKSVALVCAALFWCSAMANHPAHGQAARRACDVAVYWDGSYSGEVWRTTEDQAAAGPHWAKHITSIIIVSGIWDFYAEANYRGEVITLPPGAYPFIGDHWKDKINSFRCVRATP